MIPTSVRLLHAASEVVGGTGPLAESLGVSHAMLLKYMSGVFPVPDTLLLRAVDLILEDRDARLPPPPGGPSSWADEPRGEA